MCSSDDTGKINHLSSLSIALWKCWYHSPQGEFGRQAMGHYGNSTRHVIEKRKRKNHPD
jgi:hypothetical protein